MTTIVTIKASGSHNINIQRPGKDVQVLPADGKSVDIVLHSGDENNTLTLTEGADYVPAADDPPPGTGTGDGIGG